MMVDAEAGRESLWSEQEIGGSHCIHTQEAEHEWKERRRMRDVGQRLGGEEGKRGNCLGWKF